MATAGRVAPLPRDKFVKGEPYEKLDVVEYNGNLYMAKKASSGVLPTDTEYWMLAVNLTGKLDTTGDTENNTVSFTSADEEDPTTWKDVNVLASKEKHSSLFGKISTMFSNVRYLYKLLGTTDISALGSVTEAIATLSGNVGNMKGISSSAAITTEGEYALDAREKNASVEGTLANQLDVLNSNFDTKADKDQISNPNLLDNAWFTINSRGQSEYIGSGKYTLDRWFVESSGSTIKLVTDESTNETYLSWVTTVAAATHRLIQYISKDTMQGVIGKKVTLTCYLKHDTNNNSTWIRCSLVPKSKYDNSDYKNYYNNFEINPGDQFINYTTTFDFTAENNINEDYVLILWYFSGTRSLQIKTVKLEIGEISTLHMDTAPDIEQERLKCMLSTADQNDTYANKGALTDDLWNSTKTYVVGKYCTYNGILWKCLVENSGVTPVEGDTWTATSVSSVLKSLDARLQLLEG